MHNRTLRILAALQLLAACGGGLPAEDAAQPAALTTGVTNGGFDSGLTGWTTSGSVTTNSAGHSGAAAQVGSTNPTTDSAITQSFTVPSGGGTLSFFYKVVCPDSVSYDWATATLKDTTSGTTTTLLAKTCTNSGAWVQVTSAALTGGHNVTLTLSNHDDNYSGDATYTLYDDVVFNASSAPPPPPPPSGSLTNGGFESGLTGWTASGTTSVSTSGHSGSAAQLGSTSPSTDSSVSQTFTVPSTGGALSFWVKIVCPDSVSYDWATATLKDNTSGTSTTLLAKTCSNSGAWQQVTSAALTAGHSVTLTLANHDDNYAGDATYSLWDDVTLGGGTTPPPTGGCSTSLDCGGGTLCISGACTADYCNQRASNETGMRVTVKITKYQGLINGTNGTHEIAYGTIASNLWTYAPSVIDTQNVELAMNVASSTDSQGLPYEIPLTVGQTYELEGEYISGATANASGDAVIHFTHGDCGFVQINGTVYE